MQSSTPARTSRLAKSLAGVALLLAAALGADAQPTPDGPPLVIGEVGLTTLGEPRIASGPDGATVAVWIGECPQLAVCARTWSGAGAPVAGPFALSLPVAELDAVPAVAALAGGDFFVVWSRPGGGFAREIALARFAAGGGGVGLERLVAAASAQIFAAPDVAVDAAGAPVVVWERRRFEGEIGGQPVTVGVEIQGRRLAASGAPLGDPFRIDESDDDLVTAPALAVAPDGSFLVAWEAFAFDAAEDDVLIRRFTPGGDGAALPAGGELVIHPSVSGRQLRPAVAASSDGRFLVAWEGPTASGRRVVGQIVTAAGPLSSIPFGLGVPPGDKLRPAVAGGDGAFVVAWEDASFGGSLFAQRRDVAGLPLDSGFRVDAGGGLPLLPALAALPGEGTAGGLFAAWSEQLPDFSRRLLGRRYAGSLPPPAPCVEGPTVHCLGPEGRYRVTATWVTGDGGTGEGRLVPLTADTGAFWFFDDANIELVVKVLTACPVNGHVWVFAAGLTDVAVTLTVVDTVTGVPRTYGNPLGTAFQPIQDTAAFSCD